MLLLFVVDADPRPQGFPSRLEKRWMASMLGIPMRRVERFPSLGLSFKGMTMGGGVSKVPIGYLDGRHDDAQRGNDASIHLLRL